MTDVAFSLLVLRCKDLPLSLAFYHRLGLNFRAEQHGQGPLHYAASLKDLIIELYPEQSNAQQQERVKEPARIGFTVVSLIETLRKLQEIELTILKPPQQTQWGYKAVVLDPDGRAVEITEQE